MTDQRANETDEADATDPVLAHLTAGVAAAHSGLASAKAALDAYRIARANEDGGGFVQLKEAASIWKITEDAALRRAQKGAGVKKFGKWHVPRALL